MVESENPKMAASNMY